MDDQRDEAEPMELEDDGLDANDENVKGDDLGLDAKDTVDPETGLPVPYHSLLEQADASLEESAIQAGNAITLHLEFGDSVETPPDVPRSIRIRVPPLCNVAYAKRAVCRQLCPGVYPSFLQLSWPDTGEVLEDRSSLRAHGVADDDVLRLDIVEGDIFEALRLEEQPRSPHLETATRQQQQQEQRQAVVSAMDAGAAAAGGAAATTAEGILEDGRQGRARRNEQQQQQPRSPMSPKSPGRINRAFTREETIALLEGLKKHGFKSWKQILQDPKWADTFEGRTEVNLKDRWRTLERAAERGFTNMGRGYDKDKELHDKVLEVLELPRDKR